MRHDKILAVRIPGAMRSRLERLAKEREITLSALVRQTIKNASTQQGGSA